MAKFPRGEKKKKAAKGEGGGGEGRRGRAEGARGGRHSKRGRGLSRASLAALEAAGGWRRRVRGGGGGTSRRSRQRCCCCRGQLAFFSVVVFQTGKNERRGGGRKVESGEVESRRPAPFQSAAAFLAGFCAGAAARGADRTGDTFCPAPPAERKKERERVERSTSQFSIVPPPSGVKFCRPRFESSFHRRREKDDDTVQKF